MNERRRPAASLLRNVIPCLLVLACEPGGQEAVRHPIPDSLTIDPAEAVVVQRSTGAAAPAARPLGPRIRARTSVASIGALDAEPEYQFGSVADAVFLSDSSIAVLDRLDAAVRIYGLDGVHLSSIGGQGEGPGEFDAPMALVPRPDGLWVMDGARAIHRFDEIEGELVFRDRLEPAGFVRDACAAGGSVVVHTPSYIPGEGFEEVLVAVDREGVEGRRFSVPYRYGRRISAGRMKRGAVACPTDRTVLLAFEAQNRLDAYDPATGELLWHATFDGVRMPPVVEETRPDGRESVRVDVRAQEYHHFLLGIASGQGEGAPVVVQYGRRERAEVLDRIDRYTVESYVVDPATGTGSFIGDDIPRIMDLTSDRAILLYEEPFPRIEIVRLGEAPAAA